MHFFNIFKFLFVFSTVFLTHVYKMLLSKYFITLTCKILRILNSNWICSCLFDFSFVHVFSYTKQETKTIVHQASFCWRTWVVVWPQPHLLCRDLQCWRLLSSQVRWSSVLPGELLVLSATTPSQYIDISTNNANLSHLLDDFV